MLPFRMLAVMSRVRPGLGFLPPARRPWVLTIAPPIASLYLRLLGVRRIEVLGGETLVRLWQELEQGKSRFLVAFRHSSVTDPMVMFSLLSTGVAREARRLGVRLRRGPRGLFLYDRAMLEWAGRWLAWLFPRAGALSVFPGRFESRSVGAIRRALTEAPYPVALAPEGQVSFHDRRVAELEPGAAQLALWCLEDLRRRGRPEEVQVLPVTLRYICREKDWRGVDRLLARTERECGLSPVGDPGACDRYDRALKILERIVAIAESWYARFYGIAFPSSGSSGGPDGLQRRLDAVTEAALDVADRLLGSEPRRRASSTGRERQAEWLQRVTEGRYVGYGRIYRQDIADVARMPAVDRSLAERSAAEAWLALRHVELAGILAFMRVDYVAPGSPVERYVEFAANLWDFANRLEGGDISRRVSFKRRVVRAIVGRPIPVSSYLGSARGGRREAVARLTEDIREQFVAAAEAD